MSTIDLYLERKPILRGAVTCGWFVVLTALGFGAYLILTWLDHPLNEPQYGCITTETDHFVCGQLQH